MSPRFLKHRMKLILGLLTALVLYWPAISFAFQENEIIDETKLAASHQQTKVIQVADKDNKSGRLSSFCMDQEGNLLAAIGTAVLRLSPDGETMNRFDLEFIAQAICQTADGTIFVGGEGKLAKFSSSGESQLVKEVPWQKDQATLRQEAKKEATEQLARIVANSKESTKRLTGRIKDLKNKDELSDRDQTLLETLQKQRDAQSKSLKAMKERYTSPEYLEQAIQRRSKIVSMAANDQDVFLCTAGSSFGYEVWRVNNNFDDPKRVVENLSGCCGQCHIYADDQHLILAANTRFNVVLYDRDGAEVNKFGERGGPAGFESCCNPMNLYCATDGTILTAESGAGTIKRFDKEGQLLAVIGNATIPPGCKNVAIGHNASLNRYYMLNISKSEICVLDPNESSVESTPETSLGSGE